MPLPAERYENERFIVGLNATTSRHTKDQEIFAQLLTGIGLYA
jgi:hypothetical protein